MKTVVQSTFRHSTRAFALSCSCIAMVACSNQNTNDWFKFGGNEPSEEVQSTAELPDPVDTPKSEDVQPPATQTVQSQREQEQEVSVQSQPEYDVQEIIQLYRRLHAEMNLAGRSQVIVELLNDQRERVQLLGFDLASRDLSSGATLSNEVANSAILLLGDHLASVRTGSARLITRLALPDAMTLLTEALRTEQDPMVAEALLRGIERWPNQEAQSDVLRWYQSQGDTRIAAANAAWGLAELELWDIDTYSTGIRDVYRSIGDDHLTNADMRLMASTGTKNDIDRLITLARDPAFNEQTSAAFALAVSPLGVEPLIELANDNPVFSDPAAEAIERHRVNPNGVRLLASLPWMDQQARTDSVVRLCGQLDHEQLSDAVRLMRRDRSINDELTIRLLSPLIAGPQIISSRSAWGVALLAELELKNKRPDRAIEILSLLPSSGIDPDTSRNVSKTAMLAHVALQEYDQAAEIDLSAVLWFEALANATDQAIRIHIAHEIRERSIELSDSQEKQISEILNSASDSADTEQPDQP